jgi:endoglucanase
MIAAAVACGADAMTQIAPDAESPRDASTGDAPAAVEAATVADAALPLPAVPLHTDSRWIVDRNGKRFKLASVNWYGAEEKDFVVAGLDRARLEDIARFVQTSGFNSVRLPWSNEMFETNPIVADAAVAQNPRLRGKRALDVLDAVIDALARQGVVVILDNHMSHAEWCCRPDTDGLWYGMDYGEKAWLDDWRALVLRYRAQPAVVGVDLRNELRKLADGRSPTWGGSDPALDWRAAAIRGANAVLGVNPDLLVVIEGLDYATTLEGVYTNPVQPEIAVANRVVYSAHDYGFFYPNLASYETLKTTLGNKWGFVLTQGKPYTAPIWVGEFGTEHRLASIDGAPGSSGNGFWFKSFLRYLSEADIDWCYWALNGTEATGSTRTLGDEETYGLLDLTWSKPAQSEHLDALRLIQPSTQGP